MNCPLARSDRYVTNSIIFLDQSKEKGGLKNHEDPCGRTMRKMMVKERRRNRKIHLVQLLATKSSTWMLATLFPCQFDFKVSVCAQDTRGALPNSRMCMYELTPSHLAPASVVKSTWEGASHDSHF